MKFTLFFKEDNVVNGAAFSYFIAFRCRQMTLEEFRQTLSSATPPDGVSNLLYALWHDGKGNWEEAHNIAQDIENTDGSWVHAYLHRKEGDEWNAGYWYRRAGKPFCNESLDKEWDQLVNYFLK